MPKIKSKSNRSTSSSIHNRQFLTLFIIFLVSALIFLIIYKNNNTVSSYSTPTKVTYSETTPCADCIGIKTTLTLKDPNTYSLNLVYEGKNTSFTETGTWTKEIWKTNPPKQVYVLSAQNNGNKTYYEVKNANKIRQLNGDGNEIPENLPFTLTKTN